MEDYYSDFSTAKISSRRHVLKRIVKSKGIRHVRFPSRHLNVLKRIEGALGQAPLASEFGDSYNPNVLTKKSHRSSSWFTYRGHIRSQNPSEALDAETNNHPPLYDGDSLISQLVSSSAREEITPEPLDRETDSPISAHPPVPLNVDIHDDSYVNVVAAEVVDEYDSQPVTNALNDHALLRSNFSHSGRRGSASSTPTHRPSSESRQSKSSGITPALDYHESKCSGFFPSHCSGRLLPNRSNTTSPPRISKMFECVFGFIPHKEKSSSTNASRYQEMDRAVDNAEFDPESGEINAVIIETDSLSMLLSNILRRY